MRLSDLRDKKIRTLDGEMLGRVHEVHCAKGRITALKIGAGGFIERLTDKREGRSIPWECVKRVEAKAIIVVTDPPKRKKPSGSRTRPRTRQPSARRSKR
ncbi:MAG TPA: PRC-barrel domain-containing protein [Sphingomicrobium sp.]